MLKHRVSKVIRPVLQSMKQNDKKGFLLPPIVGYSLNVVVYLIKHYRISLRYALRLMVALVINLVNAPFRWYEKVFINPQFDGESRPDEETIFIIGHWRSGTTHLHNILCKDPQMAYISTFQSVFPETLFTRLGRWLFEGFARILIPGKRKGDNVVLGTDLPQEEEFALGHSVPLSFYYFWMFPDRIHHFYNKSIRFSEISNQRIRKWCKAYALMISKAKKNSGGSIFLSKNPPNTARIKVLLEMYPKAKFIFIHRNPVEVYLSTQNFFRKMLPHLQLKKIDRNQLDDYIFTLYKNLINDYLDQKNLIPAHQLVELSFSELERNPHECIKNIYTELGLTGYIKAKGNIDAYLKMMKHYRKNRHTIDAALLERIEKEWGFAMRLWQYDKPDHLAVTQ